MAKTKRMTKRQFDKLTREWFDRYCDEVAALVTAQAEKDAAPPRVEKPARKPRKPKATRGEP